MKLLVFSDSHSSCGLMRRFVEKIKPNMIAHLGDYYDDGQVLSESYFHIPFYQVAGNCDAYRAPVGAMNMLFLPETLSLTISRVSPVFSKIASRIVIAAAYSSSSYWFATIT